MKSKPISTIDAICVETIVHVPSQNQNQKQTLSRIRFTARALLLSELCKERFTEDSTVQVSEKVHFEAMCLILKLGPRRAVYYWHLQK